MGFGSVDEFRAALSNMVARENRSRKNGARSARRNMAVRIPYEGQMIEFDTPQEAAEFLRIQRSGRAASMGKGPLPDISSRVHQEEEIRRFQKTQAPRKEVRKTRDYKITDPQSPPTFDQAKLIGLSIGGLASYCPTLLEGDAPILGGANVFALSRLGLTKGKAAEVVKRLIDEGLTYAKTEEQQEKAREILEQVGGIACPRPAAKKNRGRKSRSNPAWTRAYNNTGLRMIPSEYPARDYEFAPKPRLAGGSADWQYSYDQFYRENPRKRKARKNGDVRWVELNEPVYYKMPQNAGPYLPQMMDYYGVGGWPASYEPAEAKKNGRTRRNRTEHLLPVPSFPATPREAALGLYAIPKTRSFPIGDLYHARMAVVWATTWPNLASKKDRVLSAVMAAYPQYDWAAFSRDELAHSKLGRRKKGR